MLAFFLGPEGHVTPTITIAVIIVGMLVLAIIDIRRREVDDYATAVLLLAAVTGLAIEGIGPAQWITALLSAAAAFMVYLNLGMRGVMGGGDVKLSIVPAFVLGASNPFLGVWWIACAILIHQMLFVISVRSLRAPVGAARALPVALPHVPAMAVAMVVATMVFPTGF